MLLNYGGTVFGKALYRTVLLAETALGIIEVCQLIIFCFVVFEVVKQVVCRSSLRKLFMEISEFYAF